jgi:hypothetical protein
MLAELLVKLNRDIAGKCKLDCVSILCILDLTIENF